MGNNEDNTYEQLLKSIIDLTVESYRFKKVFERVLLKLETGEQARYLGQLAWFNKKIDDALLNCGLNIVNLESQKYDIGMAATPINIDEFDYNEILLVEQMIEPLIMSKNSIVKTGTMILGSVKWNMKRTM